MSTEEMVKSRSAKYQEKPMPSSNYCMLKQSVVKEAITDLLQRLDQNEIRNSLRACLHCQCGLDRNTAVNLHGQLQSLYCILTRLLEDMEKIEQTSEAVVD